VFDDDLPNLLGINPVEATFILGVLYYFFGSETIYEYAREAGRLFTTYVPIVKDLTFDISREFRDYFEENRERELMRKAGVDVDKVPRRTSNVIERFQEGLKAQQETDAAAQEVSVTSSSCPDPLSLSLRASSCCYRIIQGAEVTPEKTLSALAAARVPAVGAPADLAVDRVDEGGRRQRRSKKEVLEAVQATQGPAAAAAGTAPAAATAANSNNNGVDPTNRLFAFDDGATTVELADMTAAAPATVDAGNFVFPSDFAATAATAQAATSSSSSSSSPAAAAAAAAAAAPAGMSKFQLQMSGQWNRQVMGSAAAAGLDSAGFDPSQPLGPPAPADSLVSEQAGPAESWDVEDEYGMGSFYMAPQRQQQLGQANDSSGDVPLDISVAPEDFTTAPTSVIPAQPSSSSSSSSSLSSGGGAAEAAAAAAVLADLDQDYAALRGRLVALISQQQQQIQQLQQQQGPAAASTAERGVADAAVADPPPSPPGAAATGKKSYWPPAVKRPQTTSGNM